MRIRKVAMAAFPIILLTVLTPTVSSFANWADNIKLKGDLRYRHEMIDTDNSDARHRHRIRARVALDAKANDYTKIVVQFATGSTDPVSTNQTLTNGFSSKDVRLDLAYFQMSCPSLPHAIFTAGKMKKPFYLPGGSELLWDSDLNPEGGAIDFKHEFDKSFIQLMASGLYIAERSKEEDSWLASGQVIAGTTLNEDKTSIAGGGGYFYYNDTKGISPFFDSDDAFGNSLDTNGNYLTDYRLIEAFVEVSHKMGEIPVVVMGDFVTNTEADSLNTGWLAGIKVGKTKEPGSWAFRYIYRELEKDAVIGTFSDSDFRGGGTDARGHEIGGDYQVFDNVTAKVSYFMNETGLQLDDPEDFQRLQIDLQLKFK